MEVGIENFLPEARKKHRIIGIKKASQSCEALFYNLSC